MLQSAQISKRQSEIRQSLADLAGKENPSEDEVRSMDELDKEYRSNETRFRAALTAEDEERRDAGKELETREGKEWDDLIGRFELRQAALNLDEGRALDGATAEIVQELRSQGGYRGIPIPWAALEQRAGETIASGTPDPVQTRQIIDRLFPQSVASRMGGSMVNIQQGESEYPVTTSSITAGWQSSETGDVAGPTVYATTDRPLAPDHTLGIQAKITRKAMKQSGNALEQAVRRDLNGAIAAELDKAVFLGSGASGEPDGIIADASGYGITETDISAAADWAAFRAAVVRFMKANAANSPDAVRLLIRPEVWSDMDDTLISGTAVSEWDRMVRNISAGNIAMSPNALNEPDSNGSTALLTTAAGGVPPFFVATWGAVDLIRDPYSDAASGQLRLTALTTMDVTVARPAQLEVLNNIS
ncbi:MAG: phage major capsid protein [Wenzhouxiangella sp.]|jgi:HK97 family phage major capsid protein|nr:phage major capsid protein [Wenzhouxiangella sp.]